jgi:hypothetical protein
LVVLISQPSRLAFSLELQSAYPAEQLDMLHWPLPQAGVPLTVLQGSEHPPQLTVLVAMFVSHPALVVQSPHPELHAPIWQALPLQYPCAFT